MGRNDKPIIIEFNGLPGSGKTTVAKHLLGILRQKEIRAENIDNIKKKLKKDNKYWYLKHTNLKDIIIIIHLIFLLIKTKPFQKKRIRYIKTMYLLYLIYNKKLKNVEYDIIVVDQGIVQAVISFYYLDGLSNNSYKKVLLRLLNNLYQQLLIINCSIDPVNTMNRIAERDNNERRFDNMTYDDLEKNIQTQVHMFNQLRSSQLENFNKIELNMDNNPAINSETIYERISL